MKLTHYLSRGFTLIELLVVIAIIAILAGLAIPVINRSLDRAKLIQGVHNGHQLAQINVAMAADEASSADPKLGWPGDLANSTSPGAEITTIGEYVSRLMTYNYLSAQEVNKIFGAGGLPPWDGSSPFTYQNSAWKVFKVLGTDGGSTVFLESKNYTFNTPLNGSAAPYGETGFVVVRKDTTASAYQKPQAQNVLQIGSMTGTQNPGPENPGAESPSSYLQ